MPFATIDGARLYYTLEGESGEPLVLVHGSWDDHHTWDPVAPGLATHFRVLRYDRRGHSQSEAPPGQGSVHEDVADLEALIEHLDLAPAHLAGNSFGASIALRLASKRPDILRSVIVHEPPLIDLLSGAPDTEPFRKAVMQRIAAAADLLEEGDLEAGARQFVDTIALGPGAWEQLPREEQQTLVRNALTWLDEVHDPDALSVDLAALSHFTHVALVSTGDQSPPFFAIIVDKLAKALPEHPAEDVRGRRSCASHQSPGRLRRCSPGVRPVTVRPDRPDDLGGVRT